MVDLVGKRFGRLFVVARVAVAGERETYWLCRCVCHKEKVVIGSRLKSGRSKSCGCLRQELMSVRGKNSRKHGETFIDGRALQTKEYHAYYNMLTRCYNTNTSYYKNYGGRGIRVCKRWRDSYLNFLQDIGRAPSPKHSVERKNNNGNYTPTNCYWATAKTQARNRRKTA